MQDENGLTPAERDLESALGGLRPVAASIDRDQLMFRAGRASMQRRGRAWQSAAAVLAVGLCLSLAFRPAGRRVVPVAGVPVEPSPTVVGPELAWLPADMAWAQQGSYIRVRDDVMEHGLDALPSPSGRSGPAEPPLTVQGMLGGPSREAGTKPPLTRFFSKIPPGDEK